jgi:hypothetical protein
MFDHLTNYSLIDTMYKDYSSFSAIWMNKHEAWRAWIRR